MSCRKPAAPENKKKNRKKNTGKRNALGMHFLYQLISGSAKKKGGNKKETTRNCGVSQVAEAWRGVR